jgi:hypothetical protein
MSYVNVAIVDFKSPWRGSLRTGMTFGVITLAMEALAVLPGRVALAGGQAQFGRSPTEFVIAGTFRDISDLALPVGGLVMVALAITMALRSSRGEQRLRISVARSVVGILALVSVLLWFTSAAAAEFKLQRGVDATLFDLQLASRDSSPVRTFITFLFLRRHLVPGSLALAASVVLLLRSLARSRKWTMAGRVPVFVGFTATTLAGFGLALVPLDPHVRCFRTIADRHVVGEPFPNLFATLGRSQENVRLGMKGLIERASFPPAQAEIGAGEKLLGVPSIPAPPEKVDCAAHPMARPLPVAGIEPIPKGKEGHHPLDPAAAVVLELLDRLSTELYEARPASSPIDVWQVMLESFRADDVHALAPSAPRVLAPFMNSLYEVALPDREITPKTKTVGSVIAVRQMWQAGSRTSQGLSSYMCGLGMLPYGLSFTRDFGPIPARCLIDVLADADLETSFFFGGNPSFDEMDSFFRQHRMRRIIGQMQQPRTAPTAEGGVSDRAMYAYAAAELAASAGDRARYTLLMSGSNHVPYRRPDDLPVEIDDRVEALRKDPAFIGGADDSGRLKTFAYADQALAELVEHVGSNLKRSIFVLGADHATADAFVWAPGPGWSKRDAHGRIPFVIILPEALVASASNPNRVRELVRELDVALDGHAWSQDDVPLFLLTLLGHSPKIRALPQELAWHTLGGERTSPYYTPPRPDVKVVGIDCAAELFGVDDEGAPHLPSETATFVKEEAEIYTMAPTLIPVAASLSRFLNGYANPCSSTTTNAHFPTR